MLPKVDQLTQVSHLATFTPTKKCCLECVENDLFWIFNISLSKVEPPRLIRRWRPRPLLCYCCQATKALLFFYSSPSPEAERCLMLGMSLKVLSPATSPREISWPTRGNTTKPLMHTQRSVGSIQCRVFAD